MLAQPSSRQRRRLTQCRDDVLSDYGCVTVIDRLRLVNIHYLVITYRTDRLSQQIRCVTLFVLILRTDAYVFNLRLITRGKNRRGRVSRARARFGFRMEAEFLLQATLIGGPNRLRPSRLKVSFTFRAASGHRVFKTAR